MTLTKNVVLSCLFLVTAWILIAIKGSCQSSQPASNPEASANALANIPTEDPDAGRQWCSLPIGDRKSFQLRIQRIPEHKNKLASPVSQDMALGKAGALVSGVPPINRELSISGHLWMKVATGSIPVTYRISGDKVRIETTFPQGTNVYTDDGTTAIFTPFAGSQHTTLHASDSAQHIFPIPHLYLSTRRRQELAGSSVYRTENGMLAVEIAESNHSPQWSQGSSPPSTCVVIDPNSHTIARVETIQAAENHASHIHRFSTQYLDYHEAGGLVIPGRVATYIDGSLFQVLTIDRIDTHPSLGTDIFSQEIRNVKAH